MVTGYTNDTAQIRHIYGHIVMSILTFQKVLDLASRHCQLSKHAAEMHLEGFEWPVDVVIVHFEARAPCIAAIDRQPCIDSN